MPGGQRASPDGASRAQMAELVDAPASGAGARKGVEVRVLFWAPFSCFLITSGGAPAGAGSRRDMICRACAR
jgi:hypothetical protein